MCNVYFLIGSYLRVKLIHIYIQYVVYFISEKTKAINRGKNIIQREFFFCMKGLNMEATRTFSKTNLKSCNWTLKTVNKGHKCDNCIKKSTDES